MPILFRTSEAAKYLGVSKSTLEAWRVRGGGPVFLKYGNKAVRYRQPDLDAFQEMSIRRSTSQTCGTMAGGAR